MGTGFAILCPGQGGQHAGMFDQLQQDAVAAAVLQQFDLPQRLGLPPAQLLTDRLADEKFLFANRHAQLLIVAAGLAGWHSLREHLPAPALVAGYSVGEVTAYGVAGLWSPATALAVALERAACMDACLQQVPQQGLMAVSGLLLADAAARLAQFDVHVAIVTGDDTLIAGGARAGLEAALPALTAAGARCSVLPVGIASHTPLMTAARAPLARCFDNIRWEPASIPVIAGATGLPLLDQQAACAAMLQQLNGTIHWSACMDACAERGVSVALELGPGSALSRMLRERHPHIEARSLADFRSLSGTLQWLQRRLD